MSRNGSGSGTCLRLVASLCFLMDSSLSFAPANPLPLLRIVRRLSPESTSKGSSTLSFAMSPSTTYEANKALESVDASDPKIDLSSLFIEGSADFPSFAETDVSSVEDEASVSTRSTETLEVLVEEPCSSSLYRPTSASLRPPLQWEFEGLTIWVELEEFDSDMTNVISDLSSTFGVQAIPQSHATAIYGMTHLSDEEAKRRLRGFVQDAIAHSGGWPSFRRPTGIVQDVAVAGNPGQVCSIAWAQLTLASSPEHEVVLDRLYDCMYGTKSSEGAQRHRPWTPHNSVVYDNPEETVLTLQGTLACIGRYPTLLSSGRRVKALSLWNTEGRMEQWKCLDRANFF
uniref:Protein kinase A anchor protein nuclear localisation signal domain-containing protein n=1 Tax=Odontella aurita TaxID=265563 RepID=A0A7S4JH26_9STRA|mmetsp:Transcript_46369/g.140450  ORF Transcript_46369/g.140450 Transcript_46369/m.140450 type:complete len:343 (+) Transcript_46369:364-1392(+)